MSMIVLNQDDLTVIRNKGTLEGATSVYDADALFPPVTPGFRRTLVLRGLNNGRLDWQTEDTEQFPQRDQA
jgi:hypothetical protein